jgi:hypothetical protein
MQAPYAFAKGIGDDENVLRPTHRDFRFGPMIGGTFSMLGGSFSGACRCEYKSGIGFGGYIGGFAEYLFADKWSLGLDAAIGYASVNNSMEQYRTEYIKPLIQGDYGRIEDVNIESSTVLDITALSTALLVRWEPGLSRFSFHAGVGMEVILANSLSEKDKILTSGYAYPSTMTNEKKLRDGKLDDYYAPNNVRFSAIVGAGFDHPLSKALSIRPELSVSYDLTPMVSEYSKWKYLTLRLGCKFFF